MTKERIKKLIRESSKMIGKLEKHPNLKEIYKDVNFRRIIEEGKEELEIREMTFKELTLEEQGYIETIFS